MGKLKNELLERMNQGVPERERREHFAGRFVETRNPTLAYRMAFVVDPSMTADWIARRARELLEDSDVMLRVQEMRDEAAAQTMVSVRDLLQDWHDIATADPNELVSVIADACRFCHGVGHLYHWRSEDEWGAACDLALRTKQVMPPCGGGFGFDPTRDPAFDCPACFGRGDQRVMVHDTRKLTNSARKLYKGAKETKNGIEILMHDQQAARESLAKVLGAFKEGLPVTPTRDTPAIPKDSTPQDASQRYLRIVVNNG